MTNPPIQVAYYHGLKSLENVLETVRRPGDFYTHGAMELPMPQVEVDGVGMLSFPVQNELIQKLIKHAERAPYGLGKQTIIDTSVRKVWQIAADQVRLSGKSWGTSLQKIIDNVAGGLGCEAATVSAELYKMLIYDQGAFFAAHRDTEKSDGMFGTLVVVLPSLHSGGELIIRHAGHEVTVDVSTADLSELAFIAFYADCQHEVKPITVGNRLCLVYNLVQRKKSKKKQSSISAPNYDAEVGKAAQLIQQAMQAPQSPVKIVWLLEHQYSPDGLSFSGLKNVDAARAKLLLQAAEQADCVLHLGIVHIVESGPAESYYSEYSSRGWESEDEDEEDEDEEDDYYGVSDGDFEVVEVCDSLCYVDQWVDKQDRRVEFGQIPLSDGELLPQGALDHATPDQQRLTEATGNEGASFERSYHRAALILWPRESYMNVLLQAGVGAAIPYIKEQVALCCNAGTPPTARAQAAKLVARVLTAWESRTPPIHFGLSPVKPSRVTMLSILGQLADVKLLERFIGGIVTRQFDGTENAALVACITLLTPKSAGTLFAKLLISNMIKMHGACVNLLHRLVHDHEVKTGKNWTVALQSMASAVADGVLSVGIDDTLPDEDEDDGWERTSPAQAVNAQQLVELFDALRADVFHEARFRAAMNIVARPSIFDPGAVIVPALTKLYAQQSHTSANDQAFLPLWVHAVEFLLKRSGQPPAAPKDWRQQVTLACRCKECRALQAFAQNAEMQVGRFSLRQDLRQHLEYVIRKQKIDMTCVTERKGSPHTLICTKTRRAYQQQCQQYKTDIKSFAALIKALPDAPDACTALVSRMTKARQRAEAWTANAV